MENKLKHQLDRLSAIPNKDSRALLLELYRFMKENQASETHQANALKFLIPFAVSLGPDISLADVKDKETIQKYLDTKMKSAAEDPEQKWMTTWNSTLNRIRYFYRWLYSQRGKARITSWRDWTTPDFAALREKKSKRISPYSENEIWERDEYLSIIKYETSLRNKATLALMWDLDARNHEVTELRMKHIRLKERYGEGEIPYNTKTGGGPMLLTLSFPYVRDWYNVHPFRNDPDARLICNSYTGAPITPDSVYRIFDRLRDRIQRIVNNGEITDQKEHELLIRLLNTKRWNPYCIRHSAITYDADYLPGYALNKKVRWSMNSKQPARYIKRRMGSDLRKQLLAREGIAEEDVKGKPALHICPSCKITNAAEYEYCTKCSYPLTPRAMEEVRTKDQEQMRGIIDQRVNEGIVNFLKDNPEAVAALREKAKKQKKKVAK